MYCRFDWNFWHLLSFQSKHRTLHPKNDICRLMNFKILICLKKTQTDRQTDAYTLNSQLTCWLRRFCADTMSVRFLFSFFFLKLQSEIFECSFMYGWILFIVEIFRRCYGFFGGCHNGNLNDRFIIYVCLLCFGWMTTAALNCLSLEIDIGFGSLDGWLAGWLTYGSHEWITIEMNSITLSFHLDTRPVVEWSKWVPASEWVNEWLPVIPKSLTGWLLAGRPKNTAEPHELNIICLAVLCDTASEI